MERLLLVVEEDGSWQLTDTAPVDYFFAFGLPPGELELVEAGVTLERYIASPGDMVLAWWLESGL